MGRAYIAYFDGCCEPRNPGGTAGYGAVIFRRHRIIWQNSGLIPASPETSCNVAEYLALNMLLDWFIERQLTHEYIIVKGDSKLVIEQCFGRWKIKKGLYIGYAFEAREKIRKFSQLHGTWIPREQNSLADDLSKAHLRQAGIKFEIQPEDGPDKTTENWINEFKI